MKSSVIALLCRPDLTRNHSYSEHGNAVGVIGSWGDWASFGTQPPKARWT